MERGKFVYGFSEGTGEMKDLLGGKGAGLAAMSRLGLPVPPGFTITAEACRVYLEMGGLPADLMQTVAEHLRPKVTPTRCAPAQARARLDSKMNVC